MWTCRKCILAVVLIQALVAGGLRAQWLTERFELVAGWQAIYLTVDTEETLIADLLAGYPDIEEVWRWVPEAIDQRILDEPGLPVSGVEWQVWRRGDIANSSLGIMYPDCGYIIKVKSDAAAFVLELKGAVGVRDIKWRTDGLNLLGFPSNPDTPPQTRRRISLLRKYWGKALRFSLMLAVDWRRIRIRLDSILAP